MSLFFLPFIEKSLSMDLFINRKFSEYIVACELDLEKAQSNNTKVCAIFLNIASAEYELEMYRKCIKTVQKVLKSKTNSLRGYFIHIKCLAKLGKEDECIAMCEYVLNDKNHFFEDEDVNIMLDIKEFSSSRLRENPGDQELIPLSGLTAEVNATVVLDSNSDRTYDEDKNYKDTAVFSIHDIAEFQICCPNQANDNGIDKNNLIKTVDIPVTTFTSTSNSSYDIARNGNSISINSSSCHDSDNSNSADIIVNSSNNNFITNVQDVKISTDSDTSTLTSVDSSLKVPSKPPKKKNKRPVTLPKEETILPDTTTTNSIPTTVEQIKILQIPAHLPTQPYDVKIADLKTASKPIIVEKVESVKVTKDVIKTSKVVAASPLVTPTAVTTVPTNNGRKVLPPQSPIAINIVGTTTTTAAGTGKSVILKPAAKTASLSLPEKISKTQLESMLSSILNSQDAVVTRALLKSVRPSLSCAHGDDIVDDMIAFGYLQVNTGNLSKALEIFTTLLLYQSDLPAAHLGTGSVYALEGKFIEAITSFSSAISCDESIADAWKRRGQTKVAVGQVAEGLKDLTKAMKLSDHPDIKYQRGLVFYQLRNYKRSLADFTSALTHGQFVQKAALCNYIGMCEGQMGNMKSSIHYHELALVSEPSFKEAKINFAQMHKDLGNVKIAGKVIKCL